MRNVKRKLAFVLAASNHGSLIVNRFDYQLSPDGKDGFGVGYQVLENAAFDPSEIDLTLQLLTIRRALYGDGVIALDCGANIGSHAVEWGIAMTGWGEVLAIEAQERIYYALAGNVALNNCFNVRALHAAVGAIRGEIGVPIPNYMTPSSFGSMEIKPGMRGEFIGQTIDYSPEKSNVVKLITLDGFNLPRCDMIKLDIEGMEVEALQGAETLIKAHRPILLIEAIKTDKRALLQWLNERGYKVMGAGINWLAIHRDDKTLGSLSQHPPEITL